MLLIPSHKVFWALWLPLQDFFPSQKCSEKKVTREKAPFFYLHQVTECEEKVVCKEGWCTEYMHTEATAYDALVTVGSLCKYIFVPQARMLDARAAIWLRNARPRFSFWIIVESALDQPIFAHQSKKIQQKFTKFRTFLKIHHDICFHKELWTWSSFIQHRVEYRVHVNPFHSTGLIRIMFLPA